MSEKNFSGFVLAGGKSSRMKRDKALLEIDGETFIERAVNSLSLICENRISLVYNLRQTEDTNFSGKILKIYDVYKNRGALGGIHAALRYCTSEWAIILAVDLPFVNHHVLEFLAEAAQNSPRETAAIIPRQPDEKLQPLCGIYRTRNCVEKLEMIFRTSESVSVRDFLKNLPVVYVNSKKLSERSAYWFLNINTPEDYENLPPLKQKTG